VISLAVKTGVLLAGLLLASACAPEPPPLTLRDLDGGSIDPFAGTAEGFVFVFVRSDCPISNRYAPELERLQATFGDRVALRLVYPDPTETKASVEKHLSEYELTLPALIDPEHALVEASGATVTPEAAVFRNRSEMIYRGRIDDRFPAFGVSRPATTSELRSAIEALLEGGTVEPSRTDAVGCYIADLR
jgi:thiol-disulfide isomerase/thioredoxin